MKFEVQGGELLVRPNPIHALDNILPTQHVYLEGVDAVVVPHVIDCVKVLRNLGLNAPSPIRDNYNFPGPFRPFDAQVVTAEMLTLNERMFVLNDMGTGKTAATLWAFDYLRSIGRLRRALVVCPLSTIEMTWADSIRSMFPYLKVKVLHGSAERRRKRLQTKADIYIVNHDGIKVIAPWLVDRNDIDMVIVDEGSVFRESKTARYKTLERICQRFNRGVWWLTGTPTPSAPTDAWSQVKIVNPSRVPSRFTHFEDMVMLPAGPFKKVPKANAQQFVYEAMQPAVRFSRDDCTDLPDTLYTTRHVELTKAQENAYSSMLSTLRAELDSGTLKAVNAADRTSKLLQIVAGASFNSNGEVAAIDASNRINVCLEVIEQARGKVIVFVPFVAGLLNMYDAVSKRYPSSLVYGGVSKQQRDDAFWRFQNLPSDQSRVLVANPDVMSHGLTLTEANTIVWVIPPYSYEVFDQANHRIIRPGQKQNTFIVMLEGTSLERTVYKRLRERGEMQDVLLAAVHSQTRKVI